MISSPLMTGSYERLVRDYGDYRERTEERRHGVASGEL
jgi:hypothetical protein